MPRSIPAIRALCVLFPGRLAGCIPVGGARTGAKALANQGAVAAKAVKDAFAARHIYF